MARVELGVSRMRARRRKRRLLVLLIVFFIFVIFACVLVWLSRAPFLRITSIEVKGEETVATSIIVQMARLRLSGFYLGLFAKDDVFLYPKGAIAAQLLQSIPTLQTVDVYAKDFHILSITVTERHPKALWCGTVVASSSNCQYIDENGLTYASANIVGNAYQRYYGALVGSSTPKAYLAAGEFRSLSALIDAVSQSSKNDSIESIYVDSNGDVHVGFVSGFSLLFSVMVDGGDVYQRLTLALSSEPFKSHKLSDFEYLDLRFGDKLYYKLK